MAMPHFCYLVKGAKRPSHTTNMKVFFSDLCNPTFFSDLCNPNLFTDLCNPNMFLTCATQFIFGLVQPKCIFGLVNSCHKMMETQPTHDWERLNFTLLIVVMDLLNSSRDGKDLNFKQLTQFCRFVATLGLKEPSQRGEIFRFIFHFFKSMFCSIYGLLHCCDCFI